MLTVTLGKSFKDEKEEKKMLFTVHLLCAQQWILSHLILFYKMSVIILILL